MWNAEWEYGNQETLKQWYDEQQGRGGVRKSSASVVEMYSTPRPNPRNTAGTEPVADLAITSSSGSTDCNGAKPCAYAQNDEIKNPAAKPIF